LEYWQYFSEIQRTTSNNASKGKSNPTKKVLQNNHFYDLRTIKKPIRTLQPIEFKKPQQQIFHKILELYSNHRAIDIRLQHNFHIIRQAWLLYSTEYFPDNI
jgi:hypothetical protein